MVDRQGQLRPIAVKLFLKNEMADLQQNIIAADELVIGQLCSLAHLEQGRSLAARKERLSTFLAGPSRRQRKGWLQFFMHVVDADSVGPALDFAS